MTYPKLNDAVNGRELGVVAMKRSGHHAVTNWLLCHFEGECFHLNNCEHWSERAFHTARGRTHGHKVETDLFAGFSSSYHRNGRPYAHVRHFDLDDDFGSGRDRMKAAINAERAVALALRAESRRDAYLYSFEDMDLATFLALPATLTSRGTSGRKTRIVIVRDVCNWLASRIKAGFVIDEVIVEGWKSHVRAALEPKDELVVVDYVEWHKSRAYREALAARLDLTFTDRGRDDVPSFGPAGAPGSSFDGLAYDGRGATMHVLDRWREVEDDPRFVKWARDEELRALSRAFFGFDPLG